MVVVNYQLLNLSACAIGALLSFLPLYIGIKDGIENEQLYHDLLQSIYYREASLSSLLITIPSAVDVLIDIFFHVAVLLSKRLSNKKVSDKVKHINTSTILRLSTAERSTFIIGVACVSVFTLTSPTETYSSTSLALYYSLSNFSTILTMCSIMFFLERCSKMWTPAYTSAVIIFTNVGSVVSSVSYCFGINTYYYNALNTSAAALICAACCIFFLVCAVWIMQALLWYSRTENTSHDWVSCIMEIFDETKGCRSFYKYYVPGIYTVAIVAFISSNVAWYFLQINLVEATATLICLQTAVAVVVFVVEIRIRQNEVLSGLDLLDSKRSFVRYISHEIRTPLSTVMMGLDLLVSDLDEDFDAFAIPPTCRVFSSRQMSAKFLHPKSVSSKQMSNSSLSDAGSRHCETILLIQESCRLAVEICDDLLNYEKFDDNDMPLVIKTAPAVLLFHEIVQPFNVQARRNGVVLNCNILDTGENQDTAYGESSVPNHFIPFYTIPSSPASSGQNLNQSAAAGMLQRALIDVDKRRIAHVLRNLMSNALNFTPTGGEVTVSVRLSSRMGPKFAASSRPYLQSLKGGFSRNAPESVTSSSTAPKIFDSRNSVGRDIEPLVNQSDQLSFSEGCPSLLPESQHSNALEPFGDRPPITQHTGFFINSPWSPHTATPTDNMGSSGLASGRERSNTVGMNPLSGTATPAAMTTDDTHDATKATSCASWISKKIWNRRRGGNEYGRVRKKSLCYMIVEVTDTGIGIARENLDRMFKEIVQFNPNELHGGGHGSNGLGMALSKGIVEAHGGKLWLTSAGLGKGCTFGFGLPLSKSQTIPDLLRKIEKEPILPCDTLLPEGGEGGHRPRALSLDGAIGEAKEFHCSVIAALSELSGTRGGSGESEGGPDLVPRRNSFEAHLSRADSTRDLGSAHSIVVAKDRFLHEKAFGSYADEAETKSHSEMEEDSTISVPGSSAEPAALQSTINTDFIPEVTNHPGSGTLTLSDTISAPIAAADPVLSVKDPPPEVRKELRSGGSPSRASTSSPRTPKHALIVEDSAVCRRMLGKVLQSLSITYAEAEDGLQAIQKVQRSLNPPQGLGEEINISEKSSCRNFDLILCDNIMPNMCGPAAVKAIREIGFKGPIIGVTGNMLPADVEDFIQHGANVILGKPLKIPMLLSAISNHSIPENPSPDQEASDDGKSLSRLSGGTL